MQGGELYPRERSLCPLPVFLWGGTGEAFEVFAEETGRGKVQLVGNFGYLQVAVTEHHLGGCGNGLVNPRFGCDAAHLPHYGAQVTFGETKAVGIEGKLALLLAMPVHQGNEAVENVVCRGAAVSRRVRLSVKERVVECRDSRNEVTGGGSNLLLGGDSFAEHGEQVLYQHLLFLRYGENAVFLFASKEECRVAAVDELEQIALHAHANEEKVAAHVERFHDGAWRDKHDVTGSDGILLQIDDAVHMSPLDVPDAVVFQQIGVGCVVNERLEKLRHVDHYAQPVFEERLRRYVVAFDQCVEHVLQREKLGLLHVFYLFAVMFYLYD